MSDVTRILSEIESGNSKAADELLPLVYAELRRLAAARLAHEKPGQTLQATALVHEAYLRLVGHQNEVQWENRGHFFAAASEAMRRLLVDNARRKASLKRGGSSARADIEVAELPTRLKPEQLVDLDDALEQLREKDPVKAQLVTLRYFGGLTEEQAASVLGISRTTAHRHWVFARSWLHAQLSE